MLNVTVVIVILSLFLGTFEEFLTILYFRTDDEDVAMLMFMLPMKGR